MKKPILFIAFGFGLLVLSSDSADASQPYVAAEGDSIVSGTGSTGGSNWVFQIGTYLRTDMTFTNLGLAGDTILANTNATNVLTMFTNQNATACRLVATCYFGHNDIAQNDSVVNITTNLLTFATNIHFAFPTAKIVAMTLHGINYGGTQSTFEPRRLSVNSWIKGAGTNYFNAICDIASDSRLTNFVDTTYYDADQVHLNNTGYLLVAKWVSTNLVNNSYTTCSNTYYVRTDGSDSNAGTANTAGGAWLTIQKAANTMIGGDKVQVQAGTYPENVATTASGTSSNPITYQAAGTVNVQSFYLTNAWIVLDGFTLNANNPTHNACIESSGGSRNIAGAHNNVVKNCNFDTDTVAQYHIVSYGTNWTINSNRFYNTWIGALALAGAYHTATNNYFSCSNGADLFYALGDNLTFTHNYVTNWSGRDVTSGPLKVGISYYFISTNGTMDFSNVGASAPPYITGETYGGHAGFTATGTTPTSFGSAVLGTSNHPDFIQASTDYGYPSTTNVLVEGNVVLYMNGAQFGNIEDKGNTNNVCKFTFRNNVFSRISNTMNLFASGFSFYNNTFDRCGTVSGWAVIYNTSSFGTASNLTFYNNIFYQCGTASNPAQGWYGGDAAANQVFDYNLVVGTGGGTTKSGFTEAHGINGSDPLFVSGSNLHLQSTSPCIGAGIQLNSLFTTDLDGVTRGLVWDMGPYEFGPPQGPVMTIGKSTIGKSFTSQ